MMFEATPPWSGPRRRPLQSRVFACFWGHVSVQASLSASLEATPLRTEAQRRPLSCNPSPPLANVSTSHDAPLVLGKSGRRRELSDLGLVPRSRSGRDTASHSMVECVAQSGDGAKVPASIGAKTFKRSFASEGERPSHQLHRCQFF